MLQTTTLSVRSLRAAGAAGLAVAAAALVSLAGASPANAAFTSATCEGADVTGEGASFQNNAQNAVFRPFFANAFCADVGAAPGPTITFNGTGSGAGRAALGAGGNGRSTVTRFAGSDEPLTPTTKAQIEAGLPAAGDEGKILQIPVAVGAIVPLVNFPDGCDVKSIPAANQTAPTASNFTDRVRFTKSQFEKILASDTDSDTWGELFPTITAIQGSSTTTQQCVDKQITRVVRYDGSGSTFALKDALQKYNPSRNWADLYNGSDNTLWPNAARDNGSYCGVNGVPANPPNPSVVGTPGPNGTPSLVTGCSSGGGGLVNKLKQVDGSVGYVDLSTAITNGLRITATGQVAQRDDDTYFTQLPNGSGDTAWTEATVADNGYQSDQTSGGARCNDTVFTGVPSSALGDWSQASGTNATAGWGICTLTYALAFADNAPVFGASAGEEARAATVADYLTSSVSNGAQLGLPAQNYAALPNAIKAISQAGANSIDWNTSGSGGGANNNPPVTQPGPPAAGSGTTPPAAGQPPVAAVSNAFSVPRVALSSKTGSATFSVLVPAAGTIKVEPTATVPVASASASAKKKAKTKKLKLGTITRTVSKGGTVKLTLKPTGAALKALKKAKSLKVSVKITFTPKGGTARSSTRTITLKYKAPAKKKKASKKKS